MRILTLLAFLCLLAAPGAFAAGIEWQPSQAVARNKGRVSVRDKAVYLEFSDPEWQSGLTFRPPAGQRFWDFSKYKVFAVDIENLAPATQMRLTMFLSCGSREKRDFREISTGIGLNPGEKATLRIALPHDYLAPRTQGLTNAATADNEVVAQQFNSFKGIKSLDTAHLNPVEFNIIWPFEGNVKDLVNCRLTNFRLENPVNPRVDRPVPADKFYPFVDRYGQFMHAAWPEKIRSDGDLRERYLRERKELARVTRPGSWDRFGGWAAGPQLKATGAFRVEKFGGKWWLVDPEGRLFFSHGIDVLYSHTDATPVDKNPEWFAGVPEGVVSMPYADRNLKIKYGMDDYEPAFYAALSKRLLAWGFNTIGNWGNHKIIARGETPYVLSLGEFNGGRSPRLAVGNQKFYDVFDPAYRLMLKNLIPDKGATQPVLLKSLTDPMCIGYFMDNELSFNGTVFAQNAIRCPASQPAKKEFVSDMKVKYKTVAALNAAWESEYHDWRELENSVSVPKGRGFLRDAEKFGEKAIETYFRLNREAIKAIAPHRLYLGCRMVGGRHGDFVWKTMEKYCDVISINTYSNSIANLGNAGFVGDPKTSGHGRIADKPIIIGEFHFGTTNRGMFAAGFCSSGIDQDERARAYQRFVQGALAHPNIVGCHWFQFRDQPLTGRWDGEGFQIGFVDVADTPYVEMTKMGRVIGEGMYGYRQAGKLANAMPPDAPAPGALGAPAPA
ncbi:MAG: beta-galactosidase, partial [Planctomycetes bacterium]|nr:beta-galactosidase [Planctomycetota bacterium]